MSPKKKQEITIDFDRVFLRSRNDRLPSKLFDEKTLNKLRKMSFVERNFLIQSVLNKRDKLFREKLKKSK